MSKYQLLILAFRIFFSKEVIAEVKKLVVRFEKTDSLSSGAAKRAFIEDAVLPMIKNVSIFILRALIEAVLAEVRNAKS